MTSASYVVIRYIADPARGEPRNVGVLAWSGDRHQIAISDEAVGRVVREHPRLHTESLRGLADIIRESLGLDQHPPASELRERLSTQRGYPIEFTEPRATSVSDGSTAALGVTVDRLVDRVVKPGRRFGPRAIDARGWIARQLADEIRGGRIVPFHRFAATKTGVPRTVDFFVNSGRNIALDTVRLNLKKADDIRLRADAEANKAADIASQNQVTLYVYASMPVMEGLEQASDEARAILRSAPLHLLEDIDEAAGTLAATG